MAKNKNHFAEGEIFRVLFSDPCMDVFVFYVIIS
jgi:hypothetical protein